MKRIIVTLTFFLILLSFSNIDINETSRKNMKLEIINKNFNIKNSITQGSIDLMERKLTKEKDNAITVPKQLIRKTEEIFKDVKVKGIYLSGPSIGSKRTLTNIIKLENETELNSVVIDIKDDFGNINYETKVKRAIDMGAFHKYYDPKSVIKKLHENKIYVIGRIVTFKDPILGTRYPELAIKRTNGQIFKEQNVVWVDPFNRSVWNYNIEIAEEAIKLGFDEIQFDYVRFPAVNKHEINLSYNSTQKTETDAIDGFLAFAYDKLHVGMGAKVSANVFGIICEAPRDVEGIGQDIEKVGKNIDYISPMIYPSHFANKAQNGSGQIINGIMFTAPDLMAYKVVYNSLIKAKKRIATVHAYKASIRPYLQGFTASWLAKGYYKKYTAYDIKQQIKAVYDAGYQQWILWNAANVYNENEFSKS